MTIGERAAAILAIGLFAIGLPVGFAIQRTWTSTHTAVALTGGLLALALGFALVSQALGVALADRRQQAGPPSVTVQGAGGQADPVAAQLMLLRLMDQTMRVQGQMERRGMLPTGHPADGLGEWQDSGYAVPDQPAVSRWEDRV